MSNHELTEKIRELKSLQALIQEAEQEAEAIKDVIKAHMGTEEELRAGEYKVTWKSVQSSRFDSTALKKTLPDTYAAFVKQTESRRFCIA